MSTEENLLIVGLKICNKCKHFNPNKPYIATLEGNRCFTSFTLMKERTLRENFEDIPILASNCARWERK